MPGDLNTLSFPEAGYRAARSQAERSQLILGRNVDLGGDPYGPSSLARGPEQLTDRHNRSARLFLGRHVLGGGHRIRREVHN